MAQDPFFEEQHAQVLQEAHEGEYDIESFEAGYEKGLGASARYLLHAKQYHSEGCDCMNCVIIRNICDAQEVAT